MNSIYETKITTVRWMTYDIPGNIGWIMYFIGIYKLISNEIMYEHKLALILLIIPALLMLIGIIELICERFLKLDRILTGIRLLRGFGSLTIGGIFGILSSIITAYLNINTSNFLMMLIGSFLVTIFAGLILIGFKKKVVKSYLSGK